MKRAPKNSPSDDASTSESSPGTASGAQTLLRGLAILQAVANGTRDMKTLTQQLGFSRSTTHRLTSLLVQERYLRNNPSQGYLLGSKLLELGYQAHEAIPLVALARPWLEKLAKFTGDTVHLATRDGDETLYLEKLPGTRGLEMRSRIGHRMPLLATGIGKALLLDNNDAEWQRLYLYRRNKGAPVTAPDWALVQTRMRRYAISNYAFDLEDNEPSIRCVAAPVRDSGGRIVAAVSVSSMTAYMPQKRMHALIKPVQDAAAAISAELGKRQP